MKSAQRTLTTLIFCLFPLLNSVQADSRPSWARNYRGELSFELNQDARLDQLHVEARTSARQLQVAKRAADQKRAEVQKIQKKIGELEKDLIQLNQAIAQNVTQKSQLKKQIQQAKENLQKQERQLELARSAQKSVREDVEALEKREANQSQRLEAKKQECQNNGSAECQQQVRAIAQRLKQTQNQLKSKRELLKEAKKNVQNKKQIVQKTKQSIQNKTKKIAELETANEANSNKLIAKKREKNQLTPKLNSTRQELRPLAQREQKAEHRAREFQNRFQAYRSDLIQAVLQANERGFREGQRSGRYDGQELANERGEFYGIEDGQRDGQRDGTRDGRQRAYQAGEQQGLQAGAAQARVDGERDGLAQGTRQGHQDAAQIEGESAGQRRAKASDAAQVGTEQGQKAGLARAKTTGERVGTQKGEEEEATKQESKKLEAKKIPGAYAGAFSKDVPGFPAGYQGPRARDGRGGHRREVVERAYRDGYHYGYRAELRLTYEEQVARIYDRAYNSRYERAYQDFSSRAYDSDFAQGQNDGYNQAYDNTYPRVRDDYFASARAQASQNPDRQSPEYQQTYREVEAATFQRVYEQIRLDHYKVAEQKTFDENIEEQTEIFRQKRIAEVHKIYQTQAVLKFSKASATDTGINSVASQDGVFQPGESVTYDVELINYGQKSADSVTVKLESGETVKLPSIPAGSKTLVKGAIQSQVPQQASAQQNYLNSLSTFFKLSADSSVQGRHYSNTANSQINSGRRFQKAISYPLALSELKPTQQLIYQKRTAFQVNIKNNSNRKYNGEIKVELTTNAKGKAIVKNFSSIQELKESLQLSDAQVLIDQQDDVYTPLDFQVSVTKNGVPLAKGALAFRTMAKKPYSEKGDNVVLVNSEVSSSELLDIIHDFNGIENVSILDVTLGRENQRVMNSGLKNKTLLVIERGALNAQTDRMLARSQNISLVMVDDQNQGLKNLKSLQTFKEGLSVKLKLTNLGDVDFLFANPLQNRGVKQHVPAAQANLKNYARFLNAAKLLRTNTSDYIQKVKSTMNANNFFSPTVHQSQLLEVMNIHILKEVGTVTKAYMASGGGLFGGGRDKDIAELVKDDESMFHNQLIEASDKKVRNSNVGLALAGLDSYRVAKLAFEDHDRLSDQLSTTAVNNRLFGAFIFNKGAYHDYDDDMEDEIDDYSSRLWDRFDNTDAPRFAPF